MRFDFWIKASLRERGEQRPIVESDDLEMIQLGERMLVEINPSSKILVE